MLNLSIFNKDGYNINPDRINNLEYSVITEIGYGLDIKIYTDFNGSIIHIWIIDGGMNYIPSDIHIWDSNNTTNIIIIPSSQVSVDNNGTITEIVIPNSIENFDFQYPASYGFSNYFLERISTGLIQTESFFLLENVLSEDKTYTYTYPFAQKYGPFNYISGTVSNNKCKLDLWKWNNTGTWSDNYIQLSVPVDPLIELGQSIYGNNIPDGTIIIGIDNIGNRLYISAKTRSNIAVTFTIYRPHGLTIGNNILLDDLKFRLEYASIHNLHFTYQVADSTFIEGEYNVCPRIIANLNTNDTEGFFLFNIEYGETIPSIIKSNSLELDFQTDKRVINSTIGNNAIDFLRILPLQEVDNRMLQLNIGFQTDIEGSYLVPLEICDTTFEWSNDILFKSIIEIEAIAEDERLSIALDNLGRTIDPEDELIFRNSDINEEFTDYKNLNEKRKELLLEGDNIWPYIGSYKGLFNILNYFGYSDLKLKEYYLNVDVADENYNKWKQVIIKSPITQEMQWDMNRSVLNKIYKKTNLLGLTYNINHDTGTTDVNGIPIIEDNFQFSNAEVLIKLYALKAYLKTKFLPLNTRIVDITGEGVYYERYTINTWKDWNQTIFTNIARNVKFNHPEHLYIEDIRYIDKDQKNTPDTFNTLDKWTNKYKIIDFRVKCNTPYIGYIPELHIVGTTSVNSEIRCTVTIRNNVYNIPPTGNGYMINDIITLGGGVYENPIKITVLAVDVNGAITQFKTLEDNSGNIYNNYKSLPIAFFQINVIRGNNNVWTVPANALGFNILSNGIKYYVYKVYYVKHGTDYNSIPTIQIINNVGTNLITPILETISGQQLGAFTDSIVAHTNDSNNLIGAKLSLNTEFNINWDLITASWSELSKQEDAEFRAWRTDELIAIEILNTGNDYRYNPTGGVQYDGTGPEFSISIRDGKVIKHKFIVNAITNGIGLNDIIRITVLFALSGFNNIEDGKIITGNGIPEGTIINLNYGLQEIILSDYLGNSVNTNIILGQEIYIHQGVNVDYNGYNNTNIGIYPIGGHTQNLQSWNEFGRLDFYQMQWLVKLTISPNNKTWSYDSGIGTIDNLINHEIILPYIGTYSIELRVYDSYNNISNSIKRNSLIVETQNIQITSISKWFAKPISNWNDSNIKWNNSVGDWGTLDVNITKLSELDISWNSFKISEEDPQWNPVKPIKILNAYQDDYFQGNVKSYSNNPVQSITIEGQFLRQPLNPIYDATDWIYLKNGDLILHFQISTVDTSNIGETKIVIIGNVPDIFTNNPLLWVAYREIKGNIVVENNNNIKTGDWIKCTNLNTPNNGTPILNRNTTNGTLTVKNNSTYNKGSIGYIWRKRDWHITNGTMQWNATTPLGNWIFQVDAINPETRGRFIIKDNGIDIQNEIRAGFTILECAIINNTVVWNQKFQTISCQKFQGDGLLWNIWNTSVYVIEVQVLEGITPILFNQYLLERSIEDPLNIIYLEYKFDEFISKIRWNNTIGINTTLYMEFNKYPENANFAALTLNNPIDYINNTCWFYIDNFLYGDFNFRVTNTGTWKNGIGTILEIDDPNSVLVQIDSNWNCYRDDFNKGLAETHLGTRSKDLQLLENIQLEELQHHTWDSTDIRNRIGGFTFKIGYINTNAQITYDDLVTTTLNPLNPANSYGYNYLLRFLEFFNAQDWRSYFQWDLKLLNTNNYKFKINTFVSRTTIDSTTIGLAGALLFKKTNQCFQVLSSASSVYGNLLQLDSPIICTTFTGNTEIGSNTIKNIQNLSNKSLEIGSVISQTIAFNPIEYYVTDLIIINNIILEIILDKKAILNGNFVLTIEIIGETSNCIYCENTITNNGIQLIATSIDNNHNAMATLRSTDGSVSFIGESGQLSSVSNTYSLGKIYNWYNTLYGANPNGFRDITIEYPDADITTGKYGVNNSSNFIYNDFWNNRFMNIKIIPKEYQYMDDPVFSNLLEGRSNSRKLSYLAAINQYSWDNIKVLRDNKYAPIGSKVNFTWNNSKIVGAALWNWQLFLDNQKLVEINNKDLTWLFNQYGDYRVQLTLIDNRGNISNITEIFKVTNNISTEYLEHHVDSFYINKRIPIIENIPIIINGAFDDSFGDEFD